MEQQYQNNSTVDYSLKDGETIVIQLKNVRAGHVPLFVSLLKVRLWSVF